MYFFGKFTKLKVSKNAQVLAENHGYETFGDLTFGERTFADFWGRTFGALTNGDQSNDIW